MSKSERSGILTALIVVAGLFILAILPLIGSIHRFDFQPARVAEFASSPAFTGPPAVSPGWALITLVMRVITVFAALLFLLQLMTSRSHRRIYLAVLLLLGAILIVTDLLKFDQLPAEIIITRESDDSWEDSSETDPTVQPSERAIEASLSQYVLLALALSSVLCVVGGMLWWNLSKARRLPQAESEHDAILETITDASRKLRAGEDAYIVVLFCYQEMIRILGAAGRINATCLTPREFEQLLRKLGLSDGSITELTRLFEVVRYAGRVHGDFAAQALACLDAIQLTHDCNPS